jgi:cell division GTPase FtsZ
MSVKTEKVEHEKEVIIDDVSEHTVISEPDAEPESELDADKLKALKEKFAKMQGKSEIVEEEGQDTIVTVAEEKEKEEKKEEEMPIRILEKKRRSIKFGVVGSGQAGSRIAETFYKLGYNAVAFNTAMQDLEHIQIPESNKYLLEYGIGGSARTLSIGQEAAEMHKDKIYEMVSDKLDDCQVMILTFSLGGGSGAGSSGTMIDVLSSIGKPLVIITILPMTNEDAQAKQNSLETLANLTKEVQSKRVHNLIVVDNARIESIYKDVSQIDFYPVSNEAIVEPIDVFNSFSTKSSPIKAIDSMEWAKILTDGDGLSSYGYMEVSDYEEDTSIAEAIMDNLTSNLLASGFDLKQAKYIGVMMIANRGVWDKIPSSSIDYAMAMVNDHAGIPDAVHKGIYVSDEEKEDVLKIYSFFSGLSLPDSRVSELKKEALEQQKVLKAKSEQRNLNLAINTGTTEAKTTVEKAREKIKRRRSPFNSFIPDVVDKRRK